MNSGIPVKKHLYKEVILSNRMWPNTKLTQKKLSGLGHQRIILIVTAGRMMELEALLKVQLVLLYPEVNGVNLLLHGRDGLLHGCHRELHGAP
jgi:hypothetical protein